MTDISLILEVHQPLRLNRNFHSDLLGNPSIPKDQLFKLYFDHKLNKHIFDRATRKCYSPSNNILLQQINQFKKETKKFKVSFGISGVFIEQCKRWNPKLLESFKQLARTGCVEFLGETYYHSLASLYGTDRSEFVEQTKDHQQLIRKLFGHKTKVFENTECLYNNLIAKTVQKLGYQAMITEGVERVLGLRNPNYVYQAKDSKLQVLLRNYPLSDDIGFRFSSTWWEEWPLTADKYASWLAAVPGQVINIFVDYETFGEHHWIETGIHEFLKWLPGEVNKWEHLNWRTPSEVIQKHTAVGEIDVPEYNTISWADLERDHSAWIGNPMQIVSYHHLKGLESLVKGIGNTDLIRFWRYFQMSDHLYYLSTKGAGPGDVHSYFNPYGSPIEAFTIYFGILSDFEARLMRELEKPQLAAKWALRRLPLNKGFSFSYEFARPTGQTVYSLHEFATALKTVNKKSIQFHLERGDFAQWLNQVVGEKVLAKEIASLSKQELKGEALRKRILKIVKNRISELEKTKTETPSPQLESKTSPTTTHKQKRT
jgi:alpha-amylase